MQKTSNIIDKPRKEGAEDLLGVDKYTDALIQFIETCQMPTVFNCFCSFNGVCVYYAH